MLNRASQVIRSRRGRPAHAELKGGRDTREAILNAGEDLFQRRGYNAFAYQHIAVQLGIRNAAIHYHFPGKIDLGVALIQRYRQRFRDWAESVNRSLPPWERLMAHFQTYTDYLEAQCQVCPAGVLAAEFEALPEEMRQEARLYMREIFEWLIETLEEGRSCGQLSFPGEARSKAVQIGAALQGALLIARIAGPDRFHQVRVQLGLELTPPVLT
ncbi:MAG TPA: TetR/AcrR family transcriptional regulator [Nevskiaceae bacterium]|nr:TetR/AcrR family transcriptional regulator [Nevskiaceae bacterium]